MGWKIAIPVHFPLRNQEISRLRTFAFLIKALLFSTSFFVIKLKPINSINEIEIPIIACLTEAISQATGRSKPSATKRL